MLEIYESVANLCKEVFNLVMISADLENTRERHSSAWKDCFYDARGMAAALVSDGGEKKLQPYALSRAVRVCEML